MRGIALAGLLTLAALSFAPRPVEAQSALDVQTNQAESVFPQGVNFALTASVNAEVEEVRLRYKILPDGVLTTAAPDCTEGPLLRCTFMLATSPRIFLIPGAEITYSWRFRTAAGDEQTPEQTLTYEDDRFDWQTAADGNLTIWWYEGSESEARRVLAGGRESLDRIGALLQTQVPFPVKLFYYANSSDMQPAIIPTAGGTVGGEVVYSDTAVILRSADSDDLARHELAHVVVGQAVKPPHDVPIWLNEGTAVYAQSAGFSSQDSALAAAIENDAVLSLRALTSSSSRDSAEKVSLFYAQSGALVSFLIDAYGEEKFAELFRTFNEGATTDGAFEQVYGFDQDGFENAWRESVGLPPRVAPTPDREQSVPTPVVDRDGEQAEASDGDGGGAPVVLLIAIAAITVVAAGGLLAGGVALARRWR